MNFNRTETESRQIVPGSRHANAFVASFENKDVILLSDGMIARSIGPMNFNPAVCQVTKTKKILSNSKATPLAQT